MNKKGFTMVELLGVITILGILMGVAIPAVYQYVKKSRDQAYETLLKTSYEAAESKAANTMADPSTGNITYTISELADEGYMDTPIDPNNQGVSCTGNVVIKKVSTAGIDDYKYEVRLTCSGKTMGRVFYTDGTEEELS